MYDISTKSTAVKLTRGSTILNCTLKSERANQKKKKKKKILTRVMMKRMEWWIVGLMPRPVAVEFMRRNNE